MFAESGSVPNDSATSNSSTSNESAALQEIVKKAYQQHSTLREIDDLDVMETTILGALTASMPLSDVLKAWDAFRTQFVDWNEVRISSASAVAAVPINSGNGRRAPRPAALRPTTSPPRFLPI